MCEAKSVSTALYLDMNEDLPDVTGYEKELDKFRKMENQDGTYLYGPDANDDYSDDLKAKIAKGHNYHFVGKVGQFCPIKSGCGGGILLRETLNKNTGEKGYAAATGSKGFRWMESEMVRTLNKHDDIDRSYYDKMVDDAVESISSYGDFEWFVSENTDVVIPPWILPCGDTKRKSCEGCPHFHNDEFHMECRKGYDISDVILNKIIKQKEKN